MGRPRGPSSRHTCAAHFPSTRRGGQLKVGGLPPSRALQAFLERATHLRSTESFRSASEVTVSGSKPQDSDTAGGPLGGGP